jgi:geranylgeranyl pyrophosphate synthase
MFISQSEVGQWFSEGSLNELIGRTHFEVDRIARAFILRSGHRWRPWLFAGVWGSITFDKTVPLFVARVAVAIECFHKASLIHDDIEDDDKTEALHRSIGIPQALNAGDFLIHQGYELISGIAHEYARLAMAHVVDEQMKMCRGQGQELYTKRNEYAALKTTPLFQLAFDLAQILCAPLNCQSHFCTRMGIAFQHRDDFEDGCEDEYLIHPVELTKAAISDFPNRNLRNFLNHYVDTMFGQSIPAIMPMSEAPAAAPAPAAPTDASLAP